MKYEQTIEISRLRDGASSYIHIKYSPDGLVFSANDGEKPDKWMGVYYDSKEEDSMVFNDYRWQKIVGEDSYTILLDNENISFSVDRDLFPITTQTYVVTPQIFQGTDYRTDYIVKDAVSVTGVNMEITSDSKAVVITAYPALSIPVQTGELHFTIEIDGIDFDKYVSYSISMQGIQGEPGQDGIDGVSISSHDTLFYLSDSPTVLTGGEWQTEVVWNSNKYVWSKYRTTYSDGAIVESTPVCIAGSKGSTILSIQELYLQSESKNPEDIPIPIMDEHGEFTNGWSRTAPIWEYGKYMWTCVQIIYDNPSSVEYTSPYCDTSWEAANIVNESLLQAKRELTESIGGVEQIANANKMSITNRVWQSDIIASISGINNGGVNLFDYSTVKAYKAGELKQSSNITVSGNIIYVNANPDIFPGSKIDVTSLWDSPNTLKTVVVKGYYSYQNNTDSDPHEYEDVFIKYVCYDEEDNVIQGEATNLLTFGTDSNEFLSVLTLPTNTAYLNMGVGQEFSKPYKIESLSVYDGYVYNLTGEIRDRSTQQQLTLDGVLTEISDIHTRIDGEGETSIISMINTINNTAAGMQQTIERLSSDGEAYQSQINFLADKISFVVSGDGEESEFSITPQAITSITNQFIIKDPEGNATIIEGGKILTNSITADILNTDAIKSRNYVLGENYTENDSVFSEAGTFLNLADGMIRSKNFLLNQEGNVYVNGEINATKLYVGKLNEGVLSETQRKLMLKYGYINASIWNGEYIYFDGKRIFMKTDGFEIDGAGNVTVRGDVTANSLNLAPGVKISSDHVSGLSALATSGDYADIIGAPDVNNLLYLGDITVETETLSNGLVKRTIQVGDKYNYITYDSPDGSYVLHNVGIGNAEQGSYFMVSSEGLLRANNAIIYGTVYASEGRFTGDIIGKRLFVGDYSTYIQRHLDNLFSDDPAVSEAARQTLASLTSSYLVYDGTRLLIKADTISISGQGDLNTAIGNLSSRISNITEWSDLTYQDVFNKLTNNGAIQGIYAQTDGSGNTNFFVNASYINGGYISTDVLKVGTGINLIDYPPLNYSKDSNGSFVTDKTDSNIALCDFRKNVFRTDESVYFSAIVSNTSSAANSIYFVIQFFNEAKQLLCTHSSTDTSLNPQATNVEIKKTLTVSNASVSGAEYYKLYFSTTVQGGLANIKVDSPVAYRQNSAVMIQDGIITADKIAINDLSALNATIGGFTIYSDGLYVTYNVTENNILTTYAFEIGDMDYQTNRNAPIQVRDITNNEVNFWITLSGALYAKQTIETNGVVNVGNAINAMSDDNTTTYEIVKQIKSNTVGDRALRIANNSYTDYIEMFKNIFIHGNIYTSGTIESLTDSGVQQIVNQIKSSTTSDRYLQIGYNDYTYAIDLQKNVYARYDLTVSGNLYSPNGITQTSDETQKDIIDLLSLEKYKQVLMDIDAFSFKWKNKQDDYVHFGISAQKLERAVENAGIEDLFMVRKHDGGYVVNYTDLQMLLVPIVQAHERKIIELENRIRELESKND